MRIVAGRHRGRRIESPPGLAVRPTSDRARGALFDILAHGRFTADGASPLPGARVLDAFAGTGALGLEALSRGAAHATFLEAAPAAIRSIRTNLERCGEAERAAVLRADATDPPPAAAPCALAFLDPPYGQGLAAPALAALSARGWLAEAAVCAVEIGARETFEAPPGFSLLDDRRYGAVRILLLRYGED